MTEADVAKEARNRQPRRTLGLRGRRAAPQPASVDPAEHAYGYVRHGLARASTRERLAQIFARGALASEITEVWTPEAAGLVPPQDVTFLVEAYTARVYRGLRLSISYALVGAALVGVMLFLFYRQSRPDGKPPWVIWLCAFMFGGPLLASLGRVLTLRQSARYLMAEPGLQRRLAQMVTERTALSTKILVAVWASIVVVMLVVGNGAAVRAAGLVKAGPERMQLWRWITCAFLHLGLMHLLFNASAALAWGPLVESLAGRSRLGIVFLSSIVGGSACSWWLLPTSQSVGASGGLVGLLGFLLVLGWRQGGRLPFGFARRMLGSVVSIATFGVFLFGIIDNAAHAGGMVTGVLLGLVLAPRSPPNEDGESLGIRLLGGAAWIILAAAALVSILRLLG